MVDCVTWGWPAKCVEEIEKGGLVVGIYKCGECPTTMTIQCPTEWMVERGRWPPNP